MYCPKCRREVGQSEYCENCGAATVGEIERYRAEQQPTKNITKNDDDEVITLDSIKNTLSGFSPKKLIISTIAIVLLIAAFIGYNQLGKYASPEESAKRYVNSVVAGNTDSAFEMLDFSDNQFLTKDYYSKYIDMLNLKGQKVVDVGRAARDLDEAPKKIFGTLEEKQDFKNNETIPFRVQIGSELYRFTLVKRGKMYNMFDAWKVYTRELILKWPLSAPKGTKILVDGKPVEKIEKEVNTGFLESGKAKLQRFVVNNLFPGEYEVTATLDGAKPVTLKGTPPQELQIKFEPTQELGLKLQEVTKQFLDLYYSKADVNQFNELVTPDGDFMKNQSLNSFRYSNNYTLQRVEALKLTKSRIDDIDHAYAEFQASVYYEKEYNDWFKGKITHNGTDNTRVMFAFEKKDGKWRISQSVIY